MTLITNDKSFNIAKKEIKLSIIDTNKKTEDNNI